MSRRLRRTRVLAVAGLLACLPWQAAQAQPRIQNSAAPRTLLARLAGNLWDLGRAAWATTFGLTLDNGCQMDPSGQCIKDDLDNGCKMDPSGQCIKADLDNGCKMDPDGQCIKTDLDNGCWIDPDGRPLPPSCSSQR
jgi:hypothetical protein